MSAAKSPLAEGDRALVALERARNADAHAEHELQAVRYELAAAWGASQPDFGEAAADLYTLAPTGTYEELLLALDGTPDIARYLSEARLREAEIELALARRNPGVELGAGIRRDRAGDDTSLLLSFGMPLPIRDRNQGLITESRAQREAALAGHQAARVRARTQLYRHHQELLDRRREVGMLRERALPRMESALRHTEYAYERGRYSYLEWVDAQRELLDVKRDLIGAATQYHLTLIEIERLTGVAVSRGGF